MTARSKSDPLYVTFWGTRGSISTPGARTEKYGGNTSCVSVRHRDTQIVLDAGTGIRNLGLELTSGDEAEHGPDEIHLLLSHTHWDHIQGLPFFRPAYIDGTKLHIYGSPKKERFLEAILRGQMDVEYFPVGLAELAAEVFITEISDRKLRIGSVTVDWQEQVCHPGGSVRYRLRVGKRSIVYSTDLEIDEPFARSKDTRKGRQLAAEYLDFIAGADLLIADGQYTIEEHHEMVGHGHSSIPLALELAHRQKVKRVAVFHHDPDHSDSQIDRLSSAYVAQYAGADPPMEVFWAREGLTLAV